MKAYLKKHFNLKAFIAVRETLWLPLILLSRNTARHFGHFLKICVFLNFHLSFLIRKYFLIFAVKEIHFAFSFLRFSIFFEKTLKNAKAINAKPSIEIMV